MAEIIHEQGASNGERDVEDGGAQVELTVDEIIEDHVGSFGVAQLLQVLLVSLAWVFDSQNTLVTIFSDAQPQWRCTSRALPSCGSRSTMCGLDRGDWEWVGGDRSSTIAEWGLVCGSKLAAGLPASLFFIGSLFGSSAQGKLADLYLGRKKTILLSCLLTSLTSFLTSFSPNIYAYAFFRFANGFARSGIGICCLVLSTEVVGRKWRGQVGQYGFFFFTLGFLSLPLISYLSPPPHSWRRLYRLLSLLPLSYSLLFLPFVCESPRWLALKGRQTEAMRVLAKLAALNRTKLPQNLSIVTSSTPVEQAPKAKTLWSAKWAVIRVIKVMLAGFGIGSVYYGVQLNVENLNFNLYFTVAVNALMEIPAVFLGSLLLSLVPRRVAFSLPAVVAGVTCALCILFSRKRDKKSNESWPQLILEAVGFMAASTAYDVLYIYSVEMFPTNVRNFAVSMSRQSMMLGAAIAPQLVVLGRVSPGLSFIVFGGLSVFSGVMAIWLPETRNAPLYETLEEQEREEGKIAEMEMVE